MGQYQQWLRYQDVERGLRKTRRALEEELAQQEGQLDTIFLGQLTRPAHPLVANPILCSLATTAESLPTLRPDHSSNSHHAPAAPAQGNAAQFVSNAGSEDVNTLDWLHTIFSALLPEEVEQFYAAYRQWLLHARIVELRQRLAELQGQIGMNELRIQQYQPTAIALASLARLQANGVDQIDLLDQMLERGETWLDVTMQRLDYCEQFENFLSDDYTQWCRRALDGAFDWIDTLRLAAITKSEPSTPPAAHSEEPAREEVEEAEVLLLQKLTTEADDDEYNGLAVTLKQTAVQLHAGQDEEAAHEEQPLPAIEEATAHEEQPSPDTKEGEEIEEDEQAKAETTDPLDNTVEASKKQSAVRRLVGKLWGE